MLVAGKRKKVALVACMRKLLTMLNAIANMVRHGTQLCIALDNQDGCSVNLEPSKLLFLKAHPPLKEICSREVPNPAQGLRLLTRTLLINLEQYSVCCLIVAWAPNFQMLFAFIRTELRLEFFPCIHS